MIPSDHEKNGPYYSGSDQSSEARGTADGTLEQLLACATDFDRAAGSSTDAEEWFRAESQSLLQWAEKTGKFLLPAEFRQLIDGFKLLEGGLEHQVFFRKRSGRVFKITKPPHFGHTWYLRVTSKISSGAIQPSRMISDWKTLFPHRTEFVRSYPSITSLAGLLPKRNLRSGFSFKPACGSGLTSGATLTG